MKPFSESCQQNREPILEILRKELHSQHNSLLEIGSGTGQHAVYFAPEFPHIDWQTSDLEENIEGIKQWLTEYPQPNLPPPIVLDTLHSWPQDTYDIVFSANTTHIMSWEAVRCMFHGLRRCLNPRGKLILYGPFNYQGQYTSPSNAQFDQWLKQRDASSGIRNFENLIELAGAAELTLTQDYTMPVNNRILVWQRSGAVGN